MPLATLANKPASKKPGVVQNKKKKKKGPKKNKTAAAKSTSTALARRGPTPGQVKKITQNAQTELRAKLRANGLLKEENKKKKKGPKKHKRNGARSGLLSYLPTWRNPTFRGIGGTLKTGAYGLAGGGASTILAAVMLAILDKVAPTWAAHRYAQSIATFVAAIVAVPLILSVRIFNFMGTDGRNAATTGGVLFSLGMGFNELTGRNIFGSDIGNELVGGASKFLPSTGNPVADAAAKAAIQNGATPAEAAAASVGALRGLAGRLDRHPLPQQWEPRTPARGGMHSVGSGIGRTVRM